MTTLSDRSLRALPHLVTPTQPRSIQPCEEWRPVPSYEDRYEVSDLGRVRSIGMGRNGKSGQMLKPMVSTPGLKYVQVALYRDGHRQYFKVHALVMLAFEGPCPPGMEINHIDGDAGENRRANLEYMTRSENLKHAYRLGLCSKRGERNPAALLTMAQVEQIRSRLSGGARGITLATEFGVSRSTISSIATGKGWQAP